MKKHLEEIAKSVRLVRTLALPSSCSMARAYHSHAVGSICQKQARQPPLIRSKGAAKRTPTAVLRM
jgi:hypothetical protein